MPTGQLIGQTSRASLSATSSRMEKVSRPSRSTLLTKVMIGHRAQPADLEELQCLRLDALGGVDHHHRAVDGSQRAIGVFGEVLVARRVEQVERDDAAVRLRALEGHDRGGDRDARAAARSSSSPSARAGSRPRALTSPARWIAPPASSSFSVSVVLPASGWEMIANVRREEMDMEECGFSGWMRGRSAPRKSRPYRERGPWSASRTNAGQPGCKVMRIAQLADSPEAMRTIPGLSQISPAKSRAIGYAGPGLDTDEVRARLGPDAEIGHVFPVDPQAGARVRAIDQAVAGKPFPDQRVVPRTKHPARRAACLRRASAGPRWQ